MKRTLILAASVSLAFVIGNSFAQEAQRQAPLHNTVHENYTSKWNTHLNKIAAGTQLADARESIHDATTLVGFIPFGGTGTTEWVFRVDDVSEISILVDRHEVLLETPTLRPKRTWMRFPDGTIVKLQGYYLPPKE